MVEIFCDTCGKKLIADDVLALAQVIQLHKQRCQPTNLVSPTEKDWQEKTPAFISFDESGEEIIGVLEGIDTVKLHDREVRRATVKTSEGTKRFLLTTQLEPLILDEDIGKQIKVRYEGETKSTAGRKVKQFKVWTRG